VSWLWSPQPEVVSLLGGVVLPIDLVFKFTDRAGVIPGVFRGPARVRVRGADAPVSGGDRAVLGSGGLVLPASAGSFTLATSGGLLNAASAVHAADFATTSKYPVR